MGTGFPWESQGKFPMEWDGIARIKYPMNDNECHNDNEL